MPDFILTVGGVEFEDFEVPPEISAGGKQAVDTQKYLGGLRGVYTTGPDDDPIAWSGVFLDGDAEIRCQQLDTMRRQGLPVLLTWSSFSYIVVIASFTWKYRRFSQIDYSISLEVVQDQTQPFSGDDGEDVESQMQSDIGDALNDANGFFAGVNTGLAAAVQGISDTVATVASISNASTGFLTGLQVQVSAASALAGTVLASADAEMASAGQASLFVSGTPPQLMVNRMTSLQNHSMALALAFDCSNKLSRLGKNIAAVAG